MTAGRPRLPPRRQIILRIDEVLLAELYTFYPKMQDVGGGTRYGELQKYFTRLVNEDLGKKRASLMRTAPSHARA